MEAQELAMLSYDLVREDSRESSDACELTGALVKVAAAMGTQAAEALPLALAAALVTAKRRKKNRKGESSGSAPRSSNEQAGT